MELIFKFTEQPGRPPTIRRLQGDRITIGRAFNNDLILSDPAISPHHAVIQTGENGRMVLADLDSLNGVYAGAAEKINGMHAFSSGDEFLIGKTPVFVYTPDHPVPETVPVGHASAMTAILDRPLLLAGAAILVTLLHALEQWLNMFTEFKWQEIVNVELVVLGGALLTGIFWGVLGRIFRHETNFKKQMTVILIFIIGQFFVSNLFEFLLYNTLNYFVSLAVMLFIEGILIGALLWFNLLLATNLVPRQRLRTAIVVSMLLIALSLYTEMTLEPEFSDTPEYVKILNPPSLRMAGSVEEDEFLASMTVVFDRLDSD